MSIHSLQTPLRQAAPEGATARLGRLRAELMTVAREHTAEFERAIGAAATIADEIAQGGEAYSVGARDIARRVGAQLAAAALTLEALRSRE
ncbi:MAG: hypothetical protein JO303_05300 [Caulobacteraceae bacterium]|nr:hypothetical protein [Caulobacteraceae bacterium]